MEQAEKKCVKAFRLEVAEKVDGLEHHVTATNEEENFFSRDCSSSGRDLIDIVSFRQENFVHGRDSPETYYDTILCLSVTKWIHLNWGDDGLITLFARIWRILHPGGIFVLEPQPWQSYEKNRRVSEIGFITVEDISSGGLSGTKTGFN